MDLPTLIRGWRWLLASPLEICVLGAPPEDKPTFVVSVGRALTIYARFRLRFVNHRTDRAERIIGASIVLRHRRRDGRMTVIAKLPLLTIGSSRPLELRLAKLRLKPTSAAG